MKVLVQRVYSHPSYARVAEWTRLVVFTGGGQVAVQAIGFLCGILVIRLLSTQQYALYSLSNTMLGAMTILADGGISAGVMSQGGKVWKDPDKLGTVLVTGLDLRKKFAAGSLLVALPILLILLRKHGADFLTSGLLILSVIPSFYASLSGTLLEIVPKLHQDIVPLQKTQIGANLGRLLIHLLTLFMFPWSFVAILAAGLPQLQANRQLRKISSAYVKYDHKPDVKIASAIMSMVKRILPNSIYYCLSGQITVWLISIFGSTTGVAQAGALGRLALVINIFSVMTGILLAPRFAKLPQIKTVIFKRYLQIIGGLFALGFLIVISVALFKSQILWVLGSKYSNLQTELILNTITTCLNLVAGASFSLCTSRGWAINPLIIIPVDIAAVVTGSLLIDISTLSGIFKLNIAVALILVIVNISFSLIKISRLPGEEQLQTSEN